MDTKKMGIAVFAITGAVFYAYSLRTTAPAIPGDLRDAVAGNAFEALSENGASDISVPEPKAEAVNPGHVSGMAKFSTTKSLRLVKDNGDFPAEKSAKGAFDETVSLDKAAANDLRDFPGATYYEKLKNLFDKGVPATKADLIGWKAGRVFYDDGRVEWGLLLAEESGPEDIGPLFAEKTEFVVYLFRGQRESLDYADTITPDLLNWVNKKKANDRGYRISFPMASASVIGWGVVTLEERMASGYIVERYRIRKVPEPANSTYLFTQPVDEDIYSYYFKDVTPKPKQ